MGSILLGGVICLLLITNIIALERRIGNLRNRIAALEKWVSGSGPVVPRSPGLPQSGGPGVGHPYGVVDTDKGPQVVRVPPQWDEVAFLVHLRARGLKQEDVARRLGVARTLVSDWSRGIYKPTMMHQTAIAAMFKEMDT
jgi:DNA-binding XRE family transcriptional regulator